MGALETLKQMEKTAHEWHGDPFPRTRIRYKLELERIQKIIAVLEKGAVRAEFYSPDRLRDILEFFDVDDISVEKWNVCLWTEVESLRVLLEAVELPLKYYERD